MRDTDKLLAEVLQLPQGDRAELAARLLESLDSPVVADIDAQWLAEIKRKRFLVRSPATRLGFIRQRASTTLFVNGQQITLPAPLQFAGPLFTGETKISTTSLTPHLNRKGFLSLIATLVRSGAFRLEP